MTRLEQIAFRSLVSVQHWKCGGTKCGEITSQSGHTKLPAVQ